MLSTGTLITSLQSTEGIVTQYELSFIYFKIYENGTLISSTIQYASITMLALVIGWTLNIMFAYKNRQKQIKLGRINFIFIGGLIISLFTKATMDIPGFTFAGQSMQSVFGLSLLFFMAYLNFRAIMLIKKDEELVRSADRIR
jgi:RsiW-degrading membrane proteinase PrsW (M82 family)